MTDKHVAEQKLAESLEKALKDLKKEGLFESVDSFDLSLVGNNIRVKFNESENLQELALRTKHDQKMPLSKQLHPNIRYFTPENRWCEFLAAIYFWPMYHNGQDMGPQDYQNYVGWDNPNQDSRFFSDLKKAGLIEQIPAPGYKGKGKYVITPKGKSIILQGIKDYGIAVVNPFENVKGDRRDRHNLDPSLTTKDDQMYQGEVSFMYQGVNDSEPLERAVLPEAVYDRDIDVGNQRRIYGYDTGNMDESMVRKIRGIFYRTNQELKRELGVKSDLKGIRLSKLITDNFSDEEKEIYKRIIGKAKGQLAAAGAEDYYRQFRLDRAEKVVPCDKGYSKTGNLSAEDARVFKLNRKANGSLIDTDIE